MNRRTGTVMAAIAAWLVIVAGTSTIAWVAIDRAGRGAYLTDGARPELTQSAPRPSTLTSTAVHGTTSSSTSPTRSSPSTAHRTSSTRPTSGPSSTHPAPATSSTHPTARSSSTSVTPQPPSPPAPQPVVSDSVSVSGGSVGVSCQGRTLTLRFATPRNGWSYTLERSTNTVEVSFRRNGGGQESEVHASCAGGTPAFETSSSDGGDD